MLAKYSLISSSEKKECPRNFQISYQSYKKKEDCYPPSSHILDSRAKNMLKANAGLCFSQLVTGHVSVEPFWQA